MLHISSVLEDQSTSTVRALMFRGHDYISYLPYLVVVFKLKFEVYFPGLSAEVALVTIPILSCMVLMGVTLWSSVISLDTLVCNIWNLLICVLAA
jgi:hypothetical protein